MADLTERIVTIQRHKTVTVDIGITETHYEIVHVGEEVIRCHECWRYNTPGCPFELPPRNGYCHLGKRRSEDERFNR